MKRKTVRVHDKMQRDYAYELVVAPGRGFNGVFAVSDPGSVP
jgi:hypothetical protein